MPKIKVNGQELETAPGKKLLDVLESTGTHVPHFCWHPGLPPHGNCRMCLVKVSTSRKLEVACMTNCTEGLEVTTESPEISEARKQVMEYLLINHPLDCPICDKAGECMLQDQTYSYRHGLSRFTEDKVIKDTKDLGPTVRIWGNRCISCTRCVRFTEEVSGAGELSLVNRGDHSQADVHPDVPLDNPMSLNVVDICPVGALIDKSFLFQARVWFADRPQSTCTGCSRGCSITGTVYKGELKRIQPRLNPDVNGYWMCDAGRLNNGYLTSSSRLAQGRGSLAEVVAALKAAPKGRVGLLASTGATLEELHLVKQLATAVDAKVGFLTKTVGTRWVSKSGFAIETDKTPNTKGASLLFGGTPDHRVVTDAAKRGELDVLVVINNIPDFTWPEDVVAAAGKVGFLAVADLLDGPLVAKAKFLHASAAAAERMGTVMNRDGRIGLLKRLIAPPGGAAPDIGWLQDVLVSFGARRASISAEGVFKEAFPGLDYGKVGPLGTNLPLSASSASGPQPEAK